VPKTQTAGRRLTGQALRGRRLSLTLAFDLRLRKTGIMSNEIDDRTTDYRNELAQCDRDDRAAENAEMCAPALILVSAAVAVASFTAYQTIGLTLGIIGVIAGFVWRSDLKAKSIARAERRLSLRRALDSLIPDLGQINGSITHP
jgi:hypothetical protein